MLSESSPFDSLPDELVLKILQLAIADPEERLRSDLIENFENWIPPHNFLSNIISRVSTRFRKISKDKSLWKGRVIISGDRLHVNRVVRDYLNDGTTSIKILNSGTLMQQRDLCALARKCPNMMFVKEIFETRCGTSRSLSRLDRFREDCSDNSFYHSKCSHCAF